MSRRFIVLAAILAMLFIAYFAAYGWARATHHLVRYGGGFIARPNVLSGIGWTTEELVFAPAVWLEEMVRKPLGLR